MQQKKSHNMIRVPDLSNKRIPVYVNCALLSNMYM